MEVETAALTNYMYSEFPTLQNFYEGDMCKYRKYWTCEKMKMSGGLFGGRSTIKVTSELRKINKSRTRRGNLTFDPWKISVRSVRRKRSSDQTHFLPIKKLDRGPKRFNRRRISDFPLEWLIGSAEIIQMRVTDYSTRVSGWAMQDPGVTREMRVSWKVWLCMLYGYRYLKML